MEKLAELLYALNPDTQPWNGDPYGFAEACKRGEHRAKLALRQAEALLAFDLINEDRLEAAPSMWELRRVLHMH